MMMAMYYTCNVQTTGLQSRAFVVLQGTARWGHMGDLVLGGVLLHYVASNG